jgi:hypothetical protein
MLTSCHSIKPTLQLSCLVVSSLQQLFSATLASLCTRSCSTIAMVVQYRYTYTGHMTREYICSGIHPSLPAQPLMFFGVAWVPSRTKTGCTL